MRTDLPFIVHEFKVYVRNMSDKELHQEIAGQWNATRDFDEDEMNILIEELARRAKAQEAENVYKNVDNVNISEECVHKTDKSIHEAVAWINYNAATGEETINRECHSELASTPLYKTPLQNEITCVCGAVWDGELMTIPPRENKQKPVAWMWKDGTLTSDPDFADGTWTPLFAAPVHASDISQEPVDETAKDRHVSYVCPNCYWSLDKQVESKWVGLTDEDKEFIAKRAAVYNWHDYGVIEASEAKLKEKNT